MIKRQEMFDELDSEVFIKAPGQSSGVPGFPAASWTPVEEREKKGDRKPRKKLDQERAAEEQELKQRNPPTVSKDDVFSTSSPSLTRKNVIRTKDPPSGAYRSFTVTPLKQRNSQERLSLSQGGPKVQRADQNTKVARRSRAQAQAVWCWAGMATDSSFSLLADDTLGSFILCSHPKKTKPPACPPSSFITPRKGSSLWR
ncbi:hypothetical protein FQA47_017574 [Oryzias melastigma]|uniref:Uncharacterized protein n=1 Tax=Oryzias melastigma TaxID=30732 RepID=A0A834CQI4_ORYME|nr:hypothetical protein FQA47_017574 [Oryzias melastigma]